MLQIICGAEMRFIILFKKIIDSGNVYKRIPIDLSLQYEDEDLIVFSDGEIKSSNNVLLLGYKTFSDSYVGIKQGFKDLFELDRIYDGKYFVIDLNSNRIFTDPLGLQHTYVCDSAVASEAKLIRMVLGHRYSTMLSPGKIYRVCLDSGRVNLEYTGNLINNINIPQEYIANIDYVTDIYYSLVREKVRAISEYVNESVKNVYISFSGGIDSSVVAKLCSDVLGEVNLITVCVEGSHDDKFSRVSAELLGLREQHIVHYVDVDDVSNILGDVVRLIEDWRLMQVSLALPLYIALKNYVGNNVLLMGQGSDEMFGGYKKYLDAYVSGGEEYALREMLLDIYLSYRNNFCREQKLADIFMCRLYYPLITPGAVALALNIPMNYKIRGGFDEVRKWVIRDLATKLGLPKDIVYRRKKALQYSSGIQRIIVRALGKHYRSVLYDIYMEMLREVY